MEPSPRGLHGPGPGLGASERAGLMARPGPNSTDNVRVRAVLGASSNDSSQTLYRMFRASSRRFSLANKGST
jgi:hypothetical protein